MRGEVAFLFLVCLPSIAQAGRIVGGGGSGGLTSGSTLYIQNSLTPTTTGQVLNVSTAVIGVVPSTVATVIPLTVRGFASQSANFFDVQDDSARSMVKVTGSFADTRLKIGNGAGGSAGRLVIGVNGVTEAFNFDGNFGGQFASFSETRQFVINASGSSTAGDVGISRHAAGVLRISNGVLSNIAFGSGALICGSPDATTTGFRIRNFSGQTGPSWTTEDNSGNAISTMTAGGGLFLSSVNVTTNYYTTTSSRPWVSSCGTSPSIASYSTNHSGLITVGSGVTSSCTLNFGTPVWVNPPSCIFTSNAAIASGTGTSTTSAFTFGGTSITSDVVMYQCAGSY